MGHFLVGVQHLVLRETRPAPRAPRHRPVRSVQPPLVVALSQEMPDVLDVGVIEGVVVRAPLHPLAELDGLLELQRRVLLDPRPALADEVLQAELLDIALRLEAQFLLDLDLHPQPVAVEAVLVPLPAPLHGLVAQVDVLVGPSAGMVNAHGVIGGDGTVNEGVDGAACVLLEQLPKRIGLFPQLQHVELRLSEVGLISRGFEQHRHHSSVGLKAPTDGGYGRPSTPAQTRRPPLQQVYVGNRLRGTV